MAHTLTLLSGGKTSSIGTEPWFRAGTQHAAAAGNLRLIYNLDALLPTPQFRTYWIQRNVSELKPFSSGISDLYERSDGFEEQRALLRKTESAPVGAGDSLAEALRYAPAAISLYRAWTRPDAARLTQTLEQVLYGEAPDAALFNRFAPNVTAEAGITGSETDLETRIDQSPFERSSKPAVTPLVEALLKMRPLALLHAQNTQILSDRVFVLPNSGVVLICKSPDPAALDQALQEATSLMQTGSLDPLHVSVNGRAVILSRIDLQPGAVAPQLPDVAYTAAYNNIAEWPHYKQLFALLDRNPVNPDMPSAANTPTFFSGNIRSIGDTLSRLQRATIVSSSSRDPTKFSGQRSCAACQRVWPRMDCAGRGGPGPFDRMARS